MKGPFHGDIIDKARTKFALSPAKGIEYLVKRRLLDGNPSEIAAFLLHCRFLDRLQVGEYLADQYYNRYLN